jgi:insulysin
LERFSRLFSLDEVENTIAKGVIPREIGRVADELDRTSDASRAFYFLKKSINPDHPFARFSAGSKTTLQTIPAEKGINVASRLLSFFRDHYLASKATLVVVGRDDLSSLDRWISPFSNAMSQKVSLGGRPFHNPPFPDPMINRGMTSRQAIILRSKDDVQMDEKLQTLCMEWPLALVYDGTRQTPRQTTITAHAVGFVLTQIISRRGPGGLRFFLEKYGWAPNVGSKGLPRISFPVDVDGFQILRMEIGLTLDGFSNRSAVVSAVFESIRKVIETPLQLDLIKQYLVTGLVHGYLFAPRPPDAIALAVDSIRFGIGGTSGIASNEFNWYLMPSPEDEESVIRMRQVVTDTLKIMSDESCPLVSFRASPLAVFEFSGGIVDQTISTPPVFSPWKKEPITGARYLVETRATGALSYFKSLSWFAATFDGEELSPPYLNPLIPTNIRSPRLIIESQVAWRGSRYFYLDDASDELARTSGRNLKLTNGGSWRELQTSGLSDGESNWKLWQIPPGKKGFIGLPIPVRPPEPSVECAFVVQLLSSLPATFTSSQLAFANLWLLSFDDEVLDLAELGAIVGIAYETSLNTAGLRICFRGVSQTLPSYVRRFCRRLVQHHVKLFDGSTKISESLHQHAISKQGIDTVRQVTEKEVAEQGLFFLRCTSGGILVSQGDVLPNESLRLLADLQYVFRDYGFADNFSVRPELRDLLYRPSWKPRDSSPCLLPGISLISDACGRIPRGG